MPDLKKELAQNNKNLNTPAFIKKYAVAILLAVGMLCVAGYIIYRFFSVY